MQLILWRHAEAEDGQDDLARELTAQGHKQAERVGRWLRKRLPEDFRVIASPALRTRQTAQGLADRFDIVDALAPGASARTVLRAAGWPDAGDVVVVVGHQPTLGQTAALLLAGAERDWSVKRAAAWWFEARERDAEVVLRAVIAPALV